MLGVDLVTQGSYNSGLDISNFDRHEKSHISNRAILKYHTANGPVNYHTIGSGHPTYHLKHPAIHDRPRARSQGVILNPKHKFFWQNDTQIYLKSFSV